MPKELENAGPIPTSYKPAYVRYRAFSSDATVVLVFQNNKRAATLCSKQILWELNSSLISTLSLVPINFKRRWPRSQNFTSFTFTNKYFALLVFQKGFLP